MHGRCTPPRRPPFGRRARDATRACAGRGGEKGHARGSVRRNARTRFAFLPKPFARGTRPLGDHLGQGSPHRGAGASPPASRPPTDLLAPYLGIRDYAGPGAAGEVGKRRPPRRRGDGPRLSSWGRRKFGAPRKDAVRPGYPPARRLTASTCAFVGAGCHRFPCPWERLFRPPSLLIVDWFAVVGGFH